MLNYNHVFYFHVVADEGSIVGAAERLGVSQPTISEQLRQLERALGTELFTRTRNGLVLTEAGRRAFEHTSAMFRASERLVEALAGAKVSPLTSLRVGISQTVTSAIAADFLMPVLALENCVPTLRGGDSLELMQALRGGDLDLVLSETEPVAAAQSGLVSTPIHQTQLLAVSNDSVKPDENWTNLALVHYRPTSAYRWEVDAYLDANNLAPRIAAECDDTHFMLEAAIRGGFVAFVPRGIARKAVQQKQVHLLAKLPAGGGTIHAIYDDGESADLARRAVRLLVEYAQQDPL